MVENYKLLLEKSNTLDNVGILDPKLVTMDKLHFCRNYMGLDSCT